MTAADKPGPRGPGEAESNRAFVRMARDVVLLVLLVLGAGIALVVVTGWVEQLRWSQ